MPEWLQDLYTMSVALDRKINPHCKPMPDKLVCRALGHRAPKKPAELLPAKLPVTVKCY